MKLWHIVGLVALLGLGIVACDKDDSSDTFDDIRALVPEYCAKEFACFDECETSDDCDSEAFWDDDAACQEEIKGDIDWYAPALSEKCKNYMRDLIECPLTKSCEDISWQEDRRGDCDSYGLVFEDKCDPEVEAYYGQKPEFADLLSACRNACDSRDACTKESDAYCKEEGCPWTIIHELGRRSTPECYDAVEALYPCLGNLGCNDLENGTGCEDAREAYTKHCEEALEFDYPGF